MTPRLSISGSSKRAKTADAMGRLTKAVNCRARSCAGPARSDGRCLGASSPHDGWQQQLVRLEAIAHSQVFGQAF